MRHTVYLSLGTNLGDRLVNLREARAAMPPTVQVLDCSPVYETPPWGYLDQPAFLNQVVKGETELPPAKLLDFLKNLEARLGRQPGIRYGPRLIDLDILFYDQLILETTELSIPHPQIARRPFVLVPLAELDPNLCHPVLRITASEMLAHANRTGIEVYSTEGCGQD